MLSITRILLSLESSFPREQRSSPDVFPATVLFTRESLPQLSRELARWHFFPTFPTNRNFCYKTTAFRTKRYFFTSDELLISRKGNKKQKDTLYFSGCLFVLFFRSKGAKTYTDTLPVKDIIKRVGYSAVHRKKDEDSLRPFTNL